MTDRRQLPLFPAAAPAPPAVLDGVAVREVACRTLLNQAALDDYSFNCYTGCTHGCIYCYARYMQRFHPHAEPWGRFVDVKTNAPAVLERQLRRLTPGSVFTCSACDGWQNLERRYRLTRRCSELLLDAGFHLSILTKSELVLRDLDLFAGRPVALGVTITTADETEARLWEPGAATVAARLNVIRQAHAAGLPTRIMFAPLLPGLSDTPAALRRLFALAAESGADRLWTDALNPRPRVWPSVHALLRRRHRHLLPLYRRVLFDPAARARYVRELAARIAAAADDAGVAHRLG